MALLGVCVLRTREIVLELFAQIVLTHSICEAFFLFSHLCHILYRQKGSTSVKLFVCSQLIFAFSFKTQAVQLFVLLFSLRNMCMNYYGIWEVTFTSDTSSRWLSFYGVICS